MISIWKHVNKRHGDAWFRQGVEIATSRSSFITDVKQMTETTDKTQIFVILPEGLLFLDLTPALVDEKDSKEAEKELAPALAY